MLRIRMVGLSLVAVFAMGAIASSASAVPAKPYFVRCAKVVTAGTGEFEKSTCTGAAGTKEFIKVIPGGKSLSATEECAEVAELGKGTFESSSCTGAAGTKEFIKVVKKNPGIKSTSGTSVLTTVGGLTVTCTADSNVGEITGAKSDLVTVTFTGCTGPLGVKCNSTSPKGGAGVIITKLLKSTLGYINKTTTPPEVGIDLAPNEGEFFVEFECTGFAVSKVKGSVIGKVTPVNTWVVPPSVFTLTFEQSGGKQKITKFEGGATDVLSSSLNGGAFEESGESSVDSLTISEAGEIRA